MVAPRPWTAPPICTMDPTATCCDREAGMLLGIRGSSVFPYRCALCLRPFRMRTFATDPERVRRTERPSRSSPFAICCKIAEVDHLLPFIEMERLGYLTVERCRDDRRGSRSIPFRCPRPDRTPRLQRTAAKVCGEVTVKTMAAAIERLPRFVV